MLQSVKKKIINAKNDLIDLNKRSSSDSREFKDDVGRELEKELAKLPRGQRKMAMKLYKMYNKGQVLKPNEDIDNKKHIMEKA